MSQQQNPDDFGERRMQRIDEELSLASKGIEAVASNMRHQLDEYRFVNVFLPFFAGDEDLMYFKDDELETATSKAMRTWVNVAGGAFNEVDIVRKAENGTLEVVCTVPPVLNREALKPVDSRDGEPTVFSAIAVAQNLTNHHPAQGQRYLDNYLSQRLTRMQTRGTRLEEAVRWNKIFAHYGKDLIPGTGEEPAQATTTPSQEGEVDGFDPI